MLCMMKPRLLIAMTLLLMVVLATAQTQRQREVLSIHGYAGQAKIIRSQGRAFVDLLDLARITNGSLNFEQDRIILTLAPSGASEPPGSAAQSGFSPAFRRAAIEAMASIREWGWDAAGDCPKWVSRGKGHGRNHDSRVPGSSCRQHRISLSGRVN